MPAWIHERAKHILAKNKDATKQMAFALATQQAHALGKSPKGYGTDEGRSKAKAKYDTPSDDKKTANPGGLKTKKLAHVPTFLEELLKEAAENIGQWWEQIGGPFLAKGGDHAVFKKMMEEADIPANFREKFMRAAKEKYPPGFNMGRGARAAARGGPATAEEAWQEARDAWQEVRDVWHATPGKEMAKSVLSEFGPALAGAGGLLAANSYARNAPQKEDPHTPVSPWQGRLGSYLAAGSQLGLGGAMLGRLAGKPLAGGLIGGAAGLALGEHAHRREEREAVERAERAFRTGKDKSLLSDAARTPASHLKEVLPGTALAAIAPSFMGMGGAALLGGTAAALGHSFAAKRHTGAAVEHLDKLRKGDARSAGKKKAASVRLLSPEFLHAFEDELSKIGESLPAMSSYSSGDFRRSQYSGPMGPGGFKQESLVPGLRVQGLGSAIEKPKTASMTSMLRVPESTFKPPALKAPAAVSASAKPPVASGSKGPTIADVATPKPLTATFDNMKPGAIKMNPLPGTKVEHV